MIDDLSQPSASIADSSTYELYSEPVPGNDGHREPSAAERVSSHRLHVAGGRVSTDGSRPSQFGSQFFRSSFPADKPLCPRDVAKLPRTGNDRPPRAVRYPAFVGFHIVSV